MSALQVFLVISLGAYLFGLAIEFSGRCAECLLRGLSDFTNPTAEFFPPGWGIGQSDKIAPRR